MAFADNEIKAMHAIVKAMEELEEDEQVRVAVYIVDRYAPNILSANVTVKEQSRSEAPAPA